MLLAEAWQWCVEHNAHIDCRGDTVVIEQPGQDEVHGVSLEDAVELAQALEHGWQLYQKGSINPVERGDSPEAQQAMNAFYRMQESEGTWQERERQSDLERLAYCGYED